MTEISDRYRRRAASMTERIDGVADDGWDAATPCEGWTATDLVQHLVDTTGMFFGFIGEDPPDGPPAAKDPAGAFAAARPRSSASSATAARTILARRVEDSMEWKRLGYGSAAEHIADKSGKGLGADGPARRADRGTRRSLATIRPIMARPARVAGSPSVGASVAAAAPDQPNLFGYTRPPGRIGRPSMVDPSHQCDQRAQSQPLGHACKSASMSRTVDVRADDGTSCRPEGSMR